MTGARAALAAMTCVLVMLLTGCASFKNGGDASPSPDAAASAAAAQRAAYRLEVDAPEPLRRLLTDYLDLARFQSAPAAERVEGPELERLMRAAPIQARQLVETEGYFNATIPTPTATTGPEGLPVVRIHVEPGPRATIGAVTLDAVGALTEPGAAAELASLRDRWPLQPGQPFRQMAWNDAKTLTLARLRAEGYASAGWQSTHARVDAQSNQVDLMLKMDSGPLFRVGALRIEGLQRYDESSIARLANFGPGEPYSEKLLLDFQERLQKLGLFEGATVELDADPANAQAAAVIVRVKEQPQYLTTVGIGYSANTGPRVSLEHTNRRIFGTRWIAHNKFEIGPEQQSWEGELTSHPLDGLYRNLVSGSALRLRNDDQILLGWNARVGRTQDTPRIERLYFAELTQARIDSDVLTSNARAVSINYHWVYRDIDNVLLPTRGLTTSLQAGVGYGRGTLSVLGDPVLDTQGPFTRLYGRMTWYQPFGNAWYGTARVEAGQVFARDTFGVPDTMLFRAGGDDSVRGYGYRTLAPDIDGVTVSARTLFTTSLEIARPISPRYPAYWWAAFIDAGNAADRFSEIKPAVGVGVGLRWRSPVGPLRVDLAYGEQVRQFRMHFSVGIAF